MRLANGPPGIVGRCVGRAWRKLGKVSGGYGGSRSRCDRRSLSVAGIARRQRSQVLGIAVALLALALLLTGTLTHGGQASAAPGDAGAPVNHTITYDKYSLMIDGQRTFIWSGEFEYWRLPSPSLWLDILEKMKAEGYNAVTVYFDWAYHSPAPGVYDFSGRAQRQPAARRRAGGSGST